MNSIEMREERLRRWPETDRQPASEWATRMWTQIMAPSTLEDLLPIVAEWQPHVLVHDEGDYAAPVAAAQSGIPWITHAWGSPLRPTGELAELKEHVSPLWTAHGLSVPASGGLYLHALVNPCPRFLQSDSPGVSVEWPVRPMTFSQEAEPLITDAYVGFGTVPTFANALAELAAAVRSCTDRGMRVVVTAPSQNLREQLAAIDHRLVEAREFVNLAALLPVCKVAITHAGAGTVLASLGAGVPLVLIPRGTPSQIRMAQACESAGVGRSCVDEFGIEEAVSDVLSNPAIATRSKYAATYLAGMPAASEVAARAEALVDA